MAKGFLIIFIIILKSTKKFKTLLITENMELISTTKNVTGLETEDLNSSI